MAAPVRYGEIPLESGNILRDGHRQIHIKFSDESRYVIVYCFSQRNKCSFVSLIDNHGQEHGHEYYYNSSGGYCENHSHYMHNVGPGYPLSCRLWETPPVFGWNCVPITPLTPRMIDLVKSGTPVHLAREMSQKEEHTIALEKESKEKDDRIAALEARVKELEALIASPKSDTAAVLLLELEDFFGASSDADIGNLPEFVHDAE
jgi:hypothetical protein